MKMFFTFIITLTFMITVAMISAPAQSLSQEQPKREIVIYGGINDAIANSIVQQIRAYNKTGNEQIVLKLISSPGGSVYAGLQIYDAMQESDAPIKTVCESYCMSMAAVLLTAGDVRETSQNTTIMYHQLSMGIGGGKLNDLINVVGEGIRLQGVIDEILSKHSGLDVGQIRELESVDRYLSPHTAKALGLIDEVREYADK